MKIKILLVSAFIFVFGGIVFGQTMTAVPDGQSTTTVANSARVYLIGPGDIIEAKVPGEDEFSFKAAVDDEGRIQIPYSETGIYAMCLTEKQLRADITKFWSKYLKNPQVSLSVTDRKSRQPVTVTGEVKTPKLVDLTRQTRLLELISFSNGPTEEAGSSVQVYRPRPPLCSTKEEEADWKAQVSGDSNFPSTIYSLASVIQGQEQSNPIIYPGDVVVIQKAKPVYINGEVIAPQGVLIKNGSLSLTQAIAQVNGFNREAKTKDIQILRLKPNSQERDTLAVNYDLVKKGEQKDVMLEPYDIILVGKTKKSVGQIILETVTGAAKGGIATLGTNGVSRAILY